jgi:serine/threonine protein kinase
MAERLSKTPDSGRRMGDDAPTEARGGADATLPLQPGMTPGSPLAAAGGPATRLGPYELIEMVGRGGMGTVWKARHTKLDKLVALKLLPPHLMSDADAVSRFEREMKAVGKLEHTHIVRAMDAGEADGIHYLVMEYIEGVDLSRLIKHRGPRKLAEACQMIRHASLGLAHAHEHGLVHRDIKPSNLLLSKKGQVKILDLGLARLQSEKTADEASLTVQGEVMGTPDYMAPEQWQSAHSVGPAADLYALGCTLHFLLTGQAPFAAADQSSYTHKMTAHVLQPPPALPDVPPEVEELYQKLMAKEPQQRPASAREVADELRSMIRSWTNSPAPTETIPWVPVVDSTKRMKTRRPPLGKQWWMAGIGAIALVAFSGTAIWLVSRWLASRSQPRHGAEIASQSELDKSGIASSAPPWAVSPFDAERARGFQDSWARYLGVPVEYMNSLGMQFRLIPPGEYDRGTRPERVEPLLKILRSWQDEIKLAQNWRTINEQSIGSEAPLHRVRITRPFYLAACEVTQARFQQVMKYNRSYFGPTGAGKDQVGDRARSELPVENVTFGEAIEFCQKLGAQEGLSAASVGYRLPTDAEWEYACRAGTTTPFWFGYPWDNLKLMARIDESTPIRIARFKANPFGLYDTHGNVWELCEDYFSEKDFARFEGDIAQSPTGPAGGGWHVARGGCYAVNGVMCRSASRAPAQRPSQFFGFRPTLSVEAVRGAVARN